MDWTSVVSIAITGLVGIAGVAGAIVSARIASKSATKDLQLSISAENDRQHKAEKRRIYAAFLATITEFNAAVIVYRRTRSEDSQSFITLKKQRVAMNTALSEARLIAPKKIDALLVEIVIKSGNLATIIDEGGDSNKDHPIVSEIGKIRKNLEHAMRADLGETS